MWSTWSHLLRKPFPAQLHLQDGEELAQPFIETKSTQKSSQRPGDRSNIHLRWGAVTILLISCIVWLLIRERRQVMCGFESGFRTEMAAAHAYLDTYDYWFTRGPAFNDNGEEYMRSDDNRPLYTGEPTDEIDEAWQSLVDGRFFLLTEDEARDVWGHEYPAFWDEFAGGYLAELDSQHLIHCLDHIRKSFYPDRYGAHSEGIHGDLHRDHCIDSLLQTLLCHADITPIPTRLYPNAGPGGKTIHYVDSDRPHVCRKWEPIREFVWSRHNGSLMVPPHHSSGHEVDYRDF